MKNKVCRVIKIDKNALLEFIYENFIAQEEDLLDIPSKADVTNHFEINLETGEFIFLAHNSEDADENIIPFPEEIDIKKLIDKIPNTTDSVLSHSRIYNEYTFEELSHLLND